MPNDPLSSYRSKDTYSMFRLESSEIDKSELRGTKRIIDAQLQARSSFFSVLEVILALKRTNSIFGILLSVPGHIYYCIALTISCCLPTCGPHCRAIPRRICLKTTFTTLYLKTCPSCRVIRAEVNKWRSLQPSLLLSLVSKVAA